jgi:hypothetical protein
MYDYTAVNNLFDKLSIYRVLHMIISLRQSLRHSLRQAFYIWSSTYDYMAAKNLFDKLSRKWPFD